MMKYSKSFLLVALFATAPSWAGRGAVELLLDRAAVAGLIEVSLPEPFRLALPGSSDLTLSVGAPQSVVFEDGGVEARIPLELEELGWTVSLSVRYVPAVEPVSGIVRLVPETAEPDTGLPFRFDFGRWLGPVDLPRRLDWALELNGGKEVDLTCFVQGLNVRENRLEVELSIVMPDRESR